MSAKVQDSLNSLLSSVPMLGCCLKVCRFHTITIKIYHCGEPCLLDACNHGTNSHLEYKKYFASSHLQDRIKAQKKNHVKNTKCYKPRNSFLAVAPTPSLPLSFWRLEKKLWWQGTLRWRLFLRRLHSRRCRAAGVAAGHVVGRLRPSGRLAFGRGCCIETIEADLPLWPVLCIFVQKVQSSKFWLIGLWLRLLYQNHRGLSSIMAVFRYFCP